MPHDLFIHSPAGGKCSYFQFEGYHDQCFYEPFCTQGSQGTCARVFLRLIHWSGVAGMCQIVSPKWLCQSTPVATMHEHSSCSTSAATLDIVRLLQTCPLPGQKHSTDVSFIPAGSIPIKKGIRILVIKRCNLP